MMAILYQFPRLFFWVSLPMVVMAGYAHDGGRILDFKETSFSNWEQNVTYKSSTGYHARGMAPMYHITNRVLDLFIGPDAIPEGKFKIFQYRIFGLGDNMMGYLMNMW